MQIFGHGWLPGICSCSCSDSLVNRQPSLLIGDFGNIASVEPFMSSLTFVCGSTMDFHFRQNRSSAVHGFLK